MRKLIFAGIVIGFGVKTEPVPVAVKVTVTSVEATVEHAASAHALMVIVSAAHVRPAPSWAISI